MVEIKKNKVKTEVPEVLDEATLAAIDKAGRLEPGKQGVSFDDALKRARKRHHAWQNAHLDQSA